MGLSFLWADEFNGKQNKYEQNKNKIIFVKSQRQNFLRPAAMLTSGVKSSMEQKSR